MLVSYRLSLENIKLFNNGMSPMTPSNIYSHSITWSKAQTNISSYSYAFSGYRLSDAFIGTSFTSELINITLTDAIFNFYPSVRFSKITFSIILFNPCED